VVFSFFSAIDGSGSLRVSFERMCDKLGLQNDVNLWDLCLIVIYLLLMGLAMLR
jgi:hypothetical protein